MQVTLILICLIYIGLFLRLIVVFLVKKEKLEISINNQDLEKELEELTSDNEKIKVKIKNIDYYIRRLK